MPFRMVFVHPGWLNNMRGSFCDEKRDTADKDATRLVSCTLDISRLVIDAALCMRGLMCLLTRSLSKAAYKMSP